MDVKQIIKEWLLAHGCDGLWCGEMGYDACGCGIDDLQCCDSWCMNCVPAKQDKDGLFYPVKDSITLGIFDENGKQVDAVEFRKAGN